MDEPRDDRNIDELRWQPCIESELRHDWSDADVFLEESEDIDVIDDPLDDTCISEWWERLKVGMTFELWLDLFPWLPYNKEFWQLWSWFPTLEYSLLREILLLLVVTVDAENLLFGDHRLLIEVLLSIEACRWLWACWWSWGRDDGPLLYAGADRWGLLIWWYVLFDCPCGWFVEAGKIVLVKMGGW